MFEKNFTNVTIQRVKTKKRGICLEAVNARKEKILMDICGTNAAEVPDGTNAYLFGNSLIVVTRWSDLSQSEKECLQTDPLCLAVHPCEYVQFSLRIGNGWSDVFTTLHHCYQNLNNEEEPVKEAIFIFADTHDADYIISRTVILPPFVQKLLQKANAASHSALALDGKKNKLLAQAAFSSSKDFCDLLYDLCWEKTGSSSRTIQKYDPDDVPDSIYIEISSDNEVTNLYLNEAKPKQAPMSKEVQLYLQLAEKGIADAQFNLGVCYETGDGVAQDFQKAVHWYRKAVDQGYDKAQHNLGVCYYNGYGVDADPVEAVKLFELAANQGNMNAQFNMGVAYYNGEGVEQNIIRATEWLLKAAEQGHPEAKRALGG